MNLQTQENLQTELKCKRICRFCMAQKEPLTNIYSKENRVNSAAPLPLQVMACVSIEVFTNDGMPNTICETCRLLMEHCYRFKQMCKKADTTLRQYPLTGTWPEPLDVPKIPEGLLKQYDIKKKIILNTHSAMLDEEETKYEIIKPPSSPITSTSRPKLLNKSTMKILNKNANIIHEPVLSKPVIKRNDAGQVEIVTEILDDVTRLEDPDPVSTAQPIETNVFPCPHCERSFPLRQLLDIHMVNHNRERSFVCEICEKRFFSKYDLGKHMLIHTGEKPFQCVVCTKSFTRSTLLHRHEKIHTDQPKFLCVFCEKPFLSKDELEKHTDRHKKNRPFPCKICGKSFAFKQGLERHETVHAKDQPFPCQYCDQSFSTPSKLSRHLTAHAGERPFPCKLCPKSYLLSHHLTRHLRSHTQGSGSYKCYDCERMFTTRDDLIYHSAVHATQTLVCPLCKEQFENLDQVTEHIKQHAEGEQYACEFCDLIFMTADKLQAHSDVDHVEDLAAYEEHTKNNIIDVKREVHMSYDSSQDGQPDEEVLQEFIIEEYHELQATNQGASTSRYVKQEKELIIERDQSPVKRNANKVKPPPQKILNKQAVTTRRSRENNKPAPQQPDEESNDFDDMEVETLENREAEVDDDDEDYELGEEEEDEIYEPPKKIVKAIQKNSPVISKSVTLERVTRTAVKTPIKLEPVVERRKLAERKDSITLTKLKQPTINSVLQQLPKSVTVIKKEKPAVAAVANIRKPEPAKEIRVLNERILRKPTSKESVLKQSPEVPKTVDIKTPVKVFEKKGNTSLIKVPRLSPVASTSKAAEQENKPKSKVTPQTGQPQKKLVEMMIDNRKVKVQKIMMTKAEVAAMAKEGKIEMKGGTMILKQDSKPLPGKMIARPGTSKSS